MSKHRLLQGRMTVCYIDLSYCGLESCSGSAEGLVHIEALERDPEFASALRALAELEKTE